MNSEAVTRSTFVTRLTSSAPAAIAVLEVTGPDAVSLVMQCWEPASRRTLKRSEIRYGKWLGGGKACGMGVSPVTPSFESSDRRDAYPTGYLTGEDIVVCLTGENTIELHCHGGKFAAARIIDDLALLGAKPQSIDERPSGEQTDVWSAMAGHDLLRTTTPLTTALMLEQTRGAFADALKSIERLRDASSPEQAVALIERLLSRYRVGKHLIEPWKIAVVGPPNAGKSSLLNAILGFDRAIVAPTAGTTRDVLNERTSLMGWPFEILDTAGIRASDDVVESEGIRRALASVETSDLALCLIDPFVGWTEQHTQLHKDFGPKLLWIVTKKDLGLPEPCLLIDGGSIALSAKTGEGMAELYNRVIERLIPDRDLIHFSRLRECSDALVAGVVDLQKTTIPYRPEHLSILESLKAEMLDRLA